MQGGSASAASILIQVGLEGVVRALSIDCREVISKWIEKSDRGEQKDKSVVLIDWWLASSP